MCSTILKIGVAICKMVKKNHTDIFMNSRKQIKNFCKDAHSSFTNQLKNQDFWWNLCRRLWVSYFRSILHHLVSWSLFVWHFETPRVQDCHFCLCVANSQQWQAATTFVVFRTRKSIKTRKSIISTQLRRSHLLECTRWRYQVIFILISYFHVTCIINISVSCISGRKKIFFRLFAWCAIA